MSQSPKTQEKSTNKDLLLCENKYYLEKSNVETLFNFKNKSKENIGSNSTKKIKTEKLSSNVLPKVKNFLENLVQANTVSHNIEKNDDDNENDNDDSNQTINGSPQPKTKIQLDLLLFENPQGYDESDSSSESDSD